jgi:hypothetical protein
VELEARRRWRHCGIMEMREGTGDRKRRCYVVVHKLIFFIDLASTASYPPDDMDLTDLVGPLRWHSCMWREID